MKNIKLYLIIMIVVLIGGFLVYKLAFGDTKETKIIPLTVSELEQKINNKDTFMLVISQTGCSHCEQYLPELDRALSEVNLNAYELNITGLNETNTNTLAKYVSYSGTPTTIFFTNGVEKTTLNRIIGYTSKAKILERLKSLGFVD